MEVPVFLLYRTLFLVNFRFSYRRIERTSYLVSPGEWICTLNDPDSPAAAEAAQAGSADVRASRKSSTISPSACWPAGGSLSLKSPPGRKSNTVLDYNAPCQKDAGFFFLPYCHPERTDRHGEMPELDILLDLWLHTVYRDERVQGARIRGRWSTTAAAPASHLSAIPNWRNAGVFPVPRSAVPSTSWLKTAI